MFCEKSQFQNKSYPASKSKANENLPPRDLRDVGRIDAATVERRLTGCRRERRHAG